MIQAINKYITIKPETEDNKEIITESGVIYQNPEYRKREEMKVQLKKGRVINAGEEAKKIVKEGQIVWYNPFDSYEVDGNDVCMVDGVRLYENVI